MKELIGLILHLEFKKLFIKETQNPFLQFFRYAFVGGIATIVDWLVQYFVTLRGVHYLLSAVLAFVVGLICNFSLSKLFVFKGQTAKVGFIAELLSYGTIGLVGLVLTMILMYIITDILGIYFMIGKIVATFIVLFWNYISRKILLYER